MEKILKSNSLMRKISFIFLFIVLLLSFCAFPRVLLYQPGISPQAHWFQFKAEQLALPFLSRFPIEIVLGTLSLSFLILNFITFIKIPKKIILGIVLFLSSIVGTVLVNGGTIFAILNKINYLFIPLATAFAVMRIGIFDKIRQKLIDCALFSLWAINIIWSFIGNSPVGICGNRNWFAATILVTSPWAFFFVYHLCRKYLHRFFTKCNENFIAAIIALSIISTPSIYWLLKCQTKAAFVAIGGYLFFVILLKFKLKNKILFIGAITICLTFLAFIFKENLQHNYNKDIRGPLWQNSWKMILKSPGIGHGVNSFAEKYPYFRDSAHNSRLVAAANTEHPHNEFLYLATEIGLPAAISWLVFAVCLLFLTVRTRETHCAKFGFVILFIMSMFDKTLISPPANILFWLFAGILISIELKKIIKFEEVNKVWLTTLSTASIALIIPMSFQVAKTYKASELHRKNAILEEKIAISQLTFQTRQELYFDLYDGYIEAYQNDPQNIIYPYLALHVAAELIQDYQLAEQALNICFSLSQTHEHLNYLAALTYELKSIADFNNRSKWLNKSKEYLLRQYNFHPFNLASLFSIRETLVKMDEKDLANVLNSQINQVTVNLFNNYHDKKSISSQIDTWHTQANQKDQDIINNTQNLLHGFKGLNSLDLLTPYYAVKNGYFLTHNHNFFDKNDAHYWFEIEELNSFQAKFKTLTEMIHYLNSGIRIDNQKLYNWPTEVLAQKSGNQIAVLSLASIAIKLHGGLPIILQIDSDKGTEWLLLVKSEQEEFIYRPEQQRIIKTNIKQFLNKNEFAEKVLNNKLKSRRFFLFEFPQAFCFRNNLLAKIISQNSSKISNFCPSPSIAKMNLQFYLGNNVSLTYLREPFFRFEEDTKAK